MKKYTFMIAVGTVIVGMATLDAIGQDHAKQASRAEIPSVYLKNVQVTAVRDTGWRRHYPIVD